MFKKLLFASLLAGTMATGAHAQGFYVKGGLGYAFPTATNPMLDADFAYDQQFNNSSQVWTSIKYITGSYGKGFGLNITPGYMFNEYIGAELDVNVLFAPKQTIYQTIESGSATRNRTIKDEGQLKSAIFLSPSFIVMAGGESKLKPYAKFGVTLPISGKIVVNSNYHFVNSGTTQDIISTAETKNKFSLGFVGGAGILYSINEKLSLYAEMNVTSLRLTSKKTVYTAYEEKNNGVVTKNLNNMTTSEKETEYVDEITPSSNQDTNKAANALRRYTNFSSLGLRFGVKMNFGGGNK